MMHMQTAPLPVHFHMLCESSKLYDPGQQYASHVRQLQRGEEPDVHYDFEPHVSANAWYPAVCACLGEPDFPPEVGEGAVSLSDPHRGPLFWLLVPPGPQSCAPERAASTSAMLRWRRLRAAPQRKVGLATGSLPRSAGVSVQQGQGRARAPCSPLQPFTGDNLAGGRGHQVHKSWPIAISDSDASLDPSPGSGEGAWPAGGGVGGSRSCRPRPQVSAGSLCSRGPLGESLTTRFLLRGL